MIARTWRGFTRLEDAEPYVNYLHASGLAAFASTEGNRGAFTFRRRLDDRIEFLVISLWESMDAVRRFAGENPERAVFYPEDDRYLIDRDRTVGHYEVVYRSESG